VTALPGAHNASSGIALTLAGEDNIKPLDDDGGAATATAGNIN